MFSHEPTRPHKKPVIGTLTAASFEFKRWLEESCIESFHDGDGQCWRIHSKVQLIPEPDSAHGVLWEMRLGLVTEVTGSELVATKVLCPDADARLIGLIGDDKIPLSMRPTVYTAPDEARAKELMVEALPKLKESLAQMSLVGVKRALVGRWVDARSQFGANEDGF